MSLPKDQAWFRRIATGFGWGLPLRWQGWVVMLGYLLAFGLGIIFLRKHGTGAIVGYNAALVAVLFILIIWKGEEALKKWELKNDKTEPSANNETH